VSARRSETARAGSGHSGDPTPADAGIELHDGPDKLDDGPDADPEAVARAICLRQLAAAPKTRAQLAQVLARRNVPEPAATRVLDRFTEVGLIDDAAYAHLWVRSRHELKGLSRRALAHELRTRGVSDDDAAPALETVAADDEHAAARALAERRLRSMRGLPVEVQRRRLAGMLARKGYSAEVAMQAVRDTVRQAPPAGELRDAEWAADVDGG
jgi:regulatory protein